MRHPSSSRALLAGAAGLALSASLASAALAADDQAGTTVSGVTVQTERESRAGYRIGATRSATRTDTPLVDTPQSVSIVSIKQIEDQAANSIGDAIRYTPGVFSAQGEGNRETLIFRGNSATGDFFVDGVRDDVQTYRDLYNIERLEVFKGPNAMIFGRGGIGGVVNRVTKAADWTAVREARLETGSFSHFRGSFDLGGAVNDAAALRLTGVYQNSGSYRDGVELERWGFNPTASFRAGEQTVVTLSYEHFEDDRVADRGVPSRARPAGFTGAVAPLDTPRGQFFGDPARSPTWTRTDAAGAYIEHRFSDTVSIRNRMRYADYGKFYQNVFPSAVNAAQTTVSISAYNQASTRRNLINQTDFNARVMTGSIEHTLLIGAEFGRQESANTRLEGRLGPTNAASVAAPLSNPRVSLPISWIAAASSTANAGVAKVAAGYVQDQIALNRQVQLIAGVRYESFETKVTDRRTVGFPAGGQRDFKVTDTLWSPRLGVLYKPVEAASIYGSYSKTYQPRGGDQLTGLSLSSQSLDPEAFKNLELGAKWDVRPGLNLSAAVFRLDRTNVLALSDPNDPASPTVPIGRQRTKGVEASAAGSVTDRISVVAAYTYSDGSFRDNVSGAVRAGNRLPNMPRHSASLWTRFDPTAAFGAAVGVIRQGDRFASTDNLVYLPSFTRVDAAVYWTVNERVRLQANIENLFNTRYFQYAHNNNNITPGSPTAAKVALTARF